MEPVEIYTRRHLFRPRAMVSIGFSVMTALPLLYAYLLLGTIDLLHPVKFIYDLFGGIFSTIFYWLIISSILFCTLAYRTTHYKVSNEKLRCLADSLPLIFCKTSIVHALVHSAASFLIACVLTSMIGGRYGDLIITHDSLRYLNEHKWFMVLFASISGSIFSLEQSAFGGHSLQFSAVEKPVLKRVKEMLPSLIKSSTRTARRAILVYFPAYVLFGGTTAWLVKVFLFLHDHSCVGLQTWWSMLDPPLLYQTYIVSVFINLTWAISLFIFQVYITKHAKFELTESRGEGSLLSALELKQDNLTKILALKDLSKMATTFDDERRERVFSLSMPGGHPKTWNAILSNTTTCLKELLARIELSNSQLVASYKGIVSHQASKIETLKPGFSSTLKTGAIKQNTKPWYYPSLLYKEYSDHLSGQIFFDSQKHLWSLTALSTLVNRSFTEDRYGIVQQKLGETITLLINLHQAVESLFRTAPVLGSTAAGSDMNKSSRLIGIELRVQLKEALESIAKVFHPHIGDISGLSTVHIKELESLIQ